MNCFWNSKLGVWPPDLPDLVKWNYAIMSLFKHQPTHVHKHPHVTKVMHAYMYTYIHVHTYTLNFKKKSLTLLYLCIVFWMWISNTSTLTCSEWEELNNTMQKIHGYGLHIYFEQNWKYSGDSIQIHLPPFLFTWSFTSHSM